MLGSKLVIANKSNYEQIIELSIDQQSYTFYKQELLQAFPDTMEVGPEVEEAPTDKHVIPFTLKPSSKADYKERIVNSEVKHECWYIENPVSKELTKRITLKLGAQSD